MCSPCSSARSLLGRSLHRAPQRREVQASGALPVSFEDNHSAVSVSWDDEIVDLLLKSKMVECGDVDFSDICRDGSPGMVCTFIEHGANLMEGLPIYQALEHNPLRMARLARELLVTNPTFATEPQKRLFSPALVAAALDLSRGYPSIGAVVKTYPVSKEYWPSQMTPHGLHSNARRRFPILTVPRGAQSRETPRDWLSLTGVDRRNFLLRFI